MGHLTHALNPKPYTLCPHLGEPRNLNLVPHVLRCVSAKGQQVCEEPTTVTMHWGDGVSGLQFPAGEAHGCRVQGAKVQGLGSRV